MSSVAIFKTVTVAKYCQRHLKIESQQHYDENFGLHCTKGRISLKFFEKLLFFPTYTAFSRCIKPYLDTVQYIMLLTFYWFEKREKI